MEELEGSDPETEEDRDIDYRNFLHEFQWSFRTKLLDDDEKSDDSNEVEVLKNETNTNEEIYKF